MSALANGTQLHKLDETGAAYAKTYTNVTTMGELGGERGDIEITTLDSTGKEYMPGMIDNGELNLEFNASVADYTDIETDFNAATVSMYAITFPIGTAVSNMDKKFSAYCKSCKIIGIEPDSVLKIQVNFKVTGALQAFTKPVTP